MYSFKKEIKYLDDKQEEKIRTYEFFYFTQNVTNPNISKYNNYGEVFNYNMIRYNADFLELNINNNNLFYVEYIGDFSENYEIFDGSFLIYKNMSIPFDDPANVNESVKIEMPVSPREEENVELKSTIYQRDTLNYFTTLYYFNGSISGLNNLKASLTLPKELQIREFLRPREITQEDFNTLINDLEEESSMESLQDELYKVVDDNGDVVNFRLLSYTKNNLINKVIDYNSIVNSVDTINSSNSTHENFNAWLDKSTLPTLRTLNFTEESIVSVSPDGFYAGIHTHDRTLDYTYDGYDTLDSFYSRRTSEWNGGFLQDYRTTSKRFSGITESPEISISDTNERIFLIDSYNSY